MRKQHEQRALAFSLLWSDRVVHARTHTKSAETQTNTAVGAVHRRKRKNAANEMSESDSIRMCCNSSSNSLRVSVCGR